MRNRTAVTAPMTPIRREPSGPISRDGVWTYCHHSTAGTLWQVRHEPSRFIAPDLFTTLNGARAWTASPAVWADLCTHVTALLATREIPDPLVRTDHQRARDLLMWMAERGLHPDNNHATG